ncbi:MAG: DUF4167 domain-containing protein [Rhodospirillales bacterium]
MKQGSNKRSRGRGNRKPSRTQVYDSSGPEGRIRGNANQVYDKYLALGRDAYSAGDRIAAENFFQHAEHYYRIVVAIEAARAQQEQQRGDGNQGDRNQQHNNRRHGNDGGDDRADIEATTPHDPRDPVPAFDDDDDGSADNGDNRSSGNNNQSTAEQSATPAGQPSAPKPRPERKPRRRKPAEDVSDAQSLPEGLLKPVTTSSQDKDESGDDIRHSSGTAKPRGRRPRRPKDDDTDIDQSAAD